MMKRTYRTELARRGRARYRGQEIPKGRQPFMYRAYCGETKTNEYEIDDDAFEKFIAAIKGDKAGGPAAAERFFRLYQLPGRGHTRAEETGGVEDIPSTKAMEAWVEKGEAPGALTGTLKGGGEKSVAPYKF